MIAAVDQGDRAIDHLEAERALPHRFAYAVLDRGNPLLGDRSAMDPFLEDEAGAARKGLQFDDYVAELAVSAGLFLVPTLLGHGFANGFAIADRRRVARHFDAEAPFEARQNGVEVLVIDSAKPDFMVGVVMLDDERRIFLAEPLQGARQLDVILAVGRLDRDRAVPCRIVDVDRRRDLSLREPLAGPHRIDLGDRDDIAVARFADLLGLLPLDLEERPDARMVALSGLDVRTLHDLPAEDSGHCEAPDRTVDDLEDVHGGIADIEALRR